ncbi:hypothetical protein Pcinc_020683 [Petrolisthes cinctipes]|uniref:Uncharacterized protein n=1 Tax=Petrolisthes cinctipes TaxID=88211 RepID=A0AAE1KJG9_PETCI|nr:hypothetical protein Pcinc_020683 [Petrolisthes cinctipes]
MQKLEAEVAEGEIVGILALLEEMGVEMTGATDIKAEHYNSLWKQMTEKERELDILERYSEMLRELEEVRALVAYQEGVKQTVREERSVLLNLKERLFRESVKRHRKEISEKYSEEMVLLKKELEEVRSAKLAQLGILERVRSELEEKRQEEERLRQENKKEAKFAKECLKKVEKEALEMQLRAQEENSRLSEMLREAEARDKQLALPFASKAASPMDVDSISSNIERQVAHLSSANNKMFSSGLDTITEDLESVRGTVETFCANALQNQDAQIKEGIKKFGTLVDLSEKRASDMEESMLHIVETITSLNKETLSNIEKALKTVKDQFSCSGDEARDLAAMYAINRNQLVNLLNSTFSETNRLLSAIRSSINPDEEFLKNIHLSLEKVLCSLNGTLERLKISFESPMRDTPIRAFDGIIGENPNEIEIKASAQQLREDEEEDLNYLRNNMSILSTELSIIDRYLAGIRSQNARFTIAERQAQELRGILNRLNDDTAANLFK